MRKKKINGTDLYYLDLYGHDISVDDKTFKKIQEIFMYLKKHYFFNDCNSKLKFWINDKKGTYEEFVKYNEDEELTEEELKREYSDIPEDVFIKVIFFMEGNYQFISVGKYEIKIEDINNHKPTGFYYDFRDIFTLIFKKIKENTSLIRQNKYIPFLENNLPLDDRVGYIYKKDLWKINRKYKKINNAKITKELFKKFKNYYKNNLDLKPICNMTFNKYFEMATVAYQSIGKKITEDICRNFSYYGEDFGGGSLHMVAHDTEEGFLDYRKNHENQYGGHPWGILIGSSRTRIYLNPHEEQGGYVFSLQGNYVYRAYELISIYAALKENNYPVYINEELYKEIIKYYEGDEYLGIVPQDIFSVYCSNLFEVDVKDFAHLSSLKDCENEIIWQKLQRPLLKKEKFELFFKEKIYKDLICELEKSFRFYLGQYECAMDYENATEDSKKIIDMLHLCFTGYSQWASLGIFCVETHKDAKKAYDLYQQLRYILYLKEPNRYKNTVYSNSYFPAAEDTEILDISIENDGYKVTISGETLEFIIDCLLNRKKIESFHDKEEIYKLFKKYKYTNYDNKEEIISLLNQIQFKESNQKEAIHILFYLERINYYKILKKGKKHVRTTKV